MVRTGLSNRVRRSIPPFRHSREELFQHLRAGLVRGPFGVGLYPFQREDKGYPARDRSRTLAQSHERRGDAGGQGNQLMVSGSGAAQRAGSEETRYSRQIMGRSG